MAGDDRSSVTESPVPPQRGGEPSDPLELGKGDWKATLRRTLKEIKNDRVTMIAGGMATFWFLAIFPALIAAVGFLGLVGAGKSLTDGVTDAIRTALPPGASEVLVESVRTAQRQSQDASVVAAALGIAVALWSASAGMVQLQAGLDVAYDVPEERKFLKARAVAFMLILATAVLGGLASALLVFGEPLGTAIEDAVPLGGVFGIVWEIVRWVVTLFAITVLFALFYYLAPNRKSPRWHWVSPGGIVATLIWIAASVGFSFYVTSFGSYGETYGPMAGVVVLLLWLYLTALAILVGGELNAELERQSQLKKERQGKGDERHER